MTSIASLTEFLRSEFSSLQDITDEWASSSVDSNYTDFPAISSAFTPSFYEEDNITSRLRKLYTKIAQFEHECDNPDVWNELTEMNISGRQLCVMLWFSVEWALEKNSSFECLERGSLAACTYLHLASINGSKAYHIFNSQLYQKCLEVFRSLYRCLTFDCRQAGSKSKTKAKTKPKKKQQQQQDTMMEEGEEEQDIAATFDKEEVKHLFEECSEALFVLLGKVCLSSYTEVPSLTTLLVRDMARIDIHQDSKVGVVENLEDFKMLRRLSDRSFALMHRFIDHRHTRSGYLVYSRIVYPRLAFWTFDLAVIPASTAIPVSFTTWRDVMVNFVKVRVEMGNPREMLVIFKVLENLYVRCTDRLDYRTRLAKSALNVLLVLPSRYHYEFVQRINVFSKYQRVAVRNYSIEVTPLVLQQLDLSGADPGPIEEPADSDDIRTEPSNNASKAGAEPMDKNSSSDDGSDEEEGSDSKSESESDDAEGGKQKKDKADKDAANAPSETPPREPALPILYRCIVRSCLDKASTVRLRAMFHLEELIGNDQHRELLIQNARKMFEESPKLFVGGFSDGEEDAENDEGEITAKDPMFLDDSEIVIDNIMLHIILTGCGDDSAGVRKYSLIALKAFFPYLTEENEVESAVDALKECCLDASLMVRTKAATVLDELLNNCKESFRRTLEEGWLAAVLPMINDREQSVQEIIAHIITETIVKPLLGNTNEGTWRMLHAIELENNNRRLLLRALMHQRLSGGIEASIVDRLNDKLDECPEEQDVIWMLLADLSAVYNVKPTKALGAWYALQDGDNNNRVRYVARVLSRSCLELDVVAKETLSADIDDKISNFRIDAACISSAFLCFAKLIDGVGEEATGTKKLESFGRRLLTVSRSHMRETLLKIDRDFAFPERLSARETFLIRVLTTVGEVVQFCPRLMNCGIKLFEALKTILSSDIIDEKSQPVLNPTIPSVHSSPMQSRAPSPTPSMASQGENDGSANPSQNLPVIPPRILKEAAYNRWALLTERLRAHAVLAIGKFCLMDEKIAKSTIPVFVKQLRLNADHVIRNNIALVVCDLCIRYTSMVDRYSTIVAACLNDRATVVRRQVLESLTSLIKEQFVRWEGQIMYRFVSTMLDENKEIREYTKFCLRDVLLQQFPDLFSSHFIECLMYFNNVSVSCERDDEVVDPSQRVSLHGPRNEEGRMTIYKFMLSTFDDRLKFTLMAHICTQIICPIMSGKLNYEDPCVFALLKDSLVVMSLKEIKLNMDVGKGPDEEEEPPAIVVAAAKEMIKETFRKAMIEYVMPALLDLRVFLTEKRSSLRGPLYSIFRVICREHKDQIDAFLDGDEQLKAEVEYDIRRYEMRLKAEREAARKQAEREALERRRSRRSLAVTKAVTDHVEAMERSASVEPPEVAQKAGSSPNQNASAEVPSVVVKGVRETAAVSEPVQASAPALNVSVIDEVLASMAEEPGRPLFGTPKSSVKTCSTPRSEMSSARSARRSALSAREANTHADGDRMHPITSPSATLLPAKRVAEEHLLQLKVSTSDESSVATRAVSTPNKTISDLTFADLNLSAIEGEHRRVSRRALGRQQGPHHQSMKEIEEE